MGTLTNALTEKEWPEKLWLLRAQWTAGHDSRKFMLREFYASEKEAKEASDRLCMNKPRFADGNGGLRGYNNLIVNEPICYIPERHP
jgi:hypothetical protein